MAEITDTNQGAVAPVKKGNSVPLAGVELEGKRAAALVFSHYPSDPRPRRAAEALVQAGMEAEVICLRQDDKEPAHEVFNGVKITRVPLKRKRSGKFGYFWQYGVFLLASFFILAWRTLSRRYHLVHVHNMPDILVFAALVPRICGAKVILDLHDPMPELMMTIFGLQRNSFAVRVLNRLERLSIRFADMVLTPNIAFQKLFAARSCPPDKLRVIMNSPDETIFGYEHLKNSMEFTRDPLRPFVVMYHGALVERHGLDIAVQAIEMLRDRIPNIRLRIYGKATPFVDQIMEMVAERGLEREVHYYGSKGLGQIAEAIDSCDVGIIPNRRSVFTEINLPTRIFENLARGKPVIAPSTVGIQDYFTSEELVFFDPGDAEDLARKILYVFTQPGELKEIVSRGQKVYLAHTWGKERSKLTALTAELLSENGRAETSAEQHQTTQPWVMDRL
jgi:glycosyltransferase involved in cell wall biosynthesis